MSTTEEIEQYRAWAAECQRAAQAVIDEALMKVYLELAHQWLELARIAEMLARGRSSPFPD